MQRKVTGPDTWHTLLYFSRSYYVSRCTLIKNCKPRNSYCSFYSERHAYKQRVTFPWYLFRNILEWGSLHYVLQVILQIISGIIVAPLNLGLISKKKWPLSITPTFPKLSGLILNFDLWKSNKGQRAARFCAFSFLWCFQGWREESPEQPDLISQLTQSRKLD